MTSQLYLPLEQLLSVGEMLITTSDISNGIFERIKNHLTALQDVWEGLGAASCFTGFGGSTRTLKQFMTKTKSMGKGLVTISSQMKTEDERVSQEDPTAESSPNRLIHSRGHHLLERHDVLVDHYDNGYYGNHDGNLDLWDTIGMPDYEAHLYWTRLNDYGDANGDNMVDAQDRAIRVMQVYDLNADDEVDHQDYPDSWMVNPQAYGAGGSSGGGGSTGAGTSGANGGTGSTYTPTSSSDYYYAYLNTGSGSGGSSSGGGTPSPAPTSPAPASTPATRSSDYY